MKQWFDRGFALVLCAFALTLFGCNTPKNANELLSGYSTAIEKAGYELDIRQNQVPDEDAPELSKSWGYIKLDALSADFDTNITVTETEKGVCSATIRMDQDEKNRNIEPFLLFTGTLMQRCDATFGSGEQAAIRAAKLVVDAADNAERYVRNGFTYTISLYEDSIYFDVAFPNAGFALPARELAAARGEKWSDFGISIGDFKRDFGAMVGAYDYTLTKYDKSIDELNAEKTKTLVDKPVAFLLTHKAGFVDGVLFVYLDGQTVYRVELVKTQYDGYYLSYADFAALLVRCFDASLSDDPAVATEEATAKVTKIFDAGSLDENNLHFEEEDLYPYDVFAVTPAQQ